MGQAQFLLAHKPDVVISRESLAGKGPGYALDDAGADTRQTTARTLSELIDELVGGAG